MCVQCIVHVCIYMYRQRERERDETKRIQKITVCKFILNNKINRIEFSSIAKYHTNYDL